MKKRTKLLGAAVAVLLTGISFFYYSNYSKIPYDDMENVEYGKVADNLSQEEKDILMPYKYIFSNDVGEDLRTGKEAFFLRMGEIQKENGLGFGERKEEKVGSLDITSYEMGFNVATVKYEEDAGNFKRAEFSNIYDNSVPSDVDPYLNEELMKIIINNMLNICIPKDIISEDELSLLVMDIDEMINYQDIRDIIYKYENYTVRFKIKPLDMDSTKTFVLMEVFV